MFNNHTSRWNNKPLGYGKCELNFGCNKLNQLLSFPGLQIHFSRVCLHFEGYLIELGLLYSPPSLSFQTKILYQFCIMIPTPFCVCLLLRCIIYFFVDVYIWQYEKIPKILFIIYRVVIALYIFGITVAYLINQIEFFGGVLFVYLTNLGFFVFFFYLVMAAVTAVADTWILRTRTIEGRFILSPHYINHNSLTVLCTEQNWETGPGACQ